MGKGTSQEGEPLSTFVLFHRRKNKGEGMQPMAEKCWNGKNLMLTVGETALTGSLQEVLSCLLRKDKGGEGRTSFQPGPNREDTLLAKGTECGPSHCLRVIMVLGPSQQRRGYEQEEFLIMRKRGLRPQSRAGASSQRERAAIPGMPECHREDWGPQCSTRTSR